jgi:Pyruvate/2-oxoacid:ferredoxin oxidoreductase delta subunit
MFNSYEQKQAIQYGRCKGRDICANLLLMANNRSVAQMIYFTGAGEVR